MNNEKLEKESFWSKIEQKLNIINKLDKGDFSINIL